MTPPPIVTSHHMHRNAPAWQQGGGNSAAAVAAVVVAAAAWRKHSVWQRSGGVRLGSELRITASSGHGLASRHQCRGCHRAPPRW